MNKNFITSLNGLRFYLFLLILATHYKYIISASPLGKTLYPILDQGHFAVLFFFVLSGFCIALGYTDKFDCLEKTQYISFIKKRMQKIYPLYIITGLLMLIFWHIPHNFNRLFSFIFLYIPMLAPYTPYSDGGGNGVGWFISALFLCYILTPFLIKFLKKQNLLLYLFLTYISIVIIALLPLGIPILQCKSEFLYKFPPIRVFHYSFGVILGMMYKSNLCNFKLKNNYLLEKYSYFFESLVIFLTLFIMFGFRHGDLSNPILGLPIIAFTIIYLCNINKGLLNRIFTNKVSQYLGNISFECYMIHYPLCFLFNDIIQLHCNTIMEILGFYFILLFATITVSIVYCFITKNILSKANR